MGGTPHEKEKICVQFHPENTPSNSIWETNHSFRTCLRLFPLILCSPCALFFLLLVSTCLKSTVQFSFIRMAKICLFFLAKKKNDRKNNYRCWFNFFSFCYCLCFSSIFLVFAIFFLEMIRLEGASKIIWK